MANGVWAAASLFRSDAERGGEGRGFDDAVERAAGVVGRVASSRGSPFSFCGVWDDRCESSWDGGRAWERLARLSFSFVLSFVGAVEASFAPVF